MDIRQIRELLSDGKIFTVEFVKRTTGEYRVMNARFGVKIGLKGNGSTKWNPIEKQLLTVWDIEKEAYRNIPLDAIKVIRAHGKEYRF